MKQVKLEDWKIVPDNLPNKQIRKQHWIDHRIRETEDEKYGFLFYNRIEVRMGWYMGSFAILTNKNNPIFVFDSGDLPFNDVFETDLVFGNQSEIVQLARDCYKQSLNRSFHTLCLIDIRRKLFSILSFEVACFYCLQEIDKNKFKIVLDKPDHFERYEKRMNNKIRNYSGIEIDCTKLEWMDLSKIENYCNIFWLNPEKFEIK
ncbi:MAG TPA: hypothetical protein VL651_15155 [Bacteroidia bacterium]|nr:hypothetical protein [Bacteroidia bacterium]